MRVQFEVYTEIKTFERNLVTMEVETLEEARAILEDSDVEWIKHYESLDCIEEMSECREDTGYYEVQIDTLEVIEE